MTDRAVHDEALGDDVDHAASADVLIARIAADRRAGRDTSKDVQALLEIAGKDNRAALDRLAK